MGKLKAFFFLCSVIALTLTACKKDSASPLITSVEVNGVVANNLGGDHALGSTLNFKVTATDDSGLELYEVTLEGETAILAEGVLDGASDSFTYSFLVDNTKYALGDEISLTFLVQDTRGSIDVAPYAITVE